jgi:tricorn protease
MNKGYYRFPTISDKDIMFTSEGDIWRLKRGERVAFRVTAHHGVETHPIISPDGKKVAYRSQYKGVDSCFIMDIDGGDPEYINSENYPAKVTSWIDNENLLFISTMDSTLPEERGYKYNLLNKEVTPIELSQTSGGVIYDGKLYFVRLPFQGSMTKRYKGGSVENLWIYDFKNEAKRIFSNFDGTEKAPMIIKDRLYFLTDRDGYINIWSSTLDGKNLKQETKFDRYDITYASCSSKEIIFSYCGDLYIFDPSLSKIEKVDIGVNSDFEQTHKRWIRDLFDHFGGYDINGDGKESVINSRGKYIKINTKKNRSIYYGDISDRERVTNCQMVNNTIYFLSDRSGEYEIYKDDGKEIVQLTDGSRNLITEYKVSPDEKTIIITNKDNQLFILDVESGKNRLIEESNSGGYGEFDWDSSSRYLLISAFAKNTHDILKIYDRKNEKLIQITSDRYSSYRGKFSPDGEWIYFLSEREFNSVNESPWGLRQPEPHFEQCTGVYMLSTADPFLTPPFIESVDEDCSEDEKKSDDEKDQEVKEDKPEFEIDFNNIRKRSFRVPVPFDNYYDIIVGKKVLYLQIDDGNGKFSIDGIKIDEGEERKTYISELDSWRVNSKVDRALILKDEQFYIFELGDEISEVTEFDEGLVRIEGYGIEVDPVKEWEQIFRESWRLERDYFYDRSLHGLDYKANLEKYLPILPKVKDRDELNDLIAQMVSELSALHTFVGGGDLRRDFNSAKDGFLGAKCRFEDGICYIEKIYDCDPDDTELISPLLRVDIIASEGDRVEAINGKRIGSNEALNSALSNRGGTLISIELKKGDTVIKKDIKLLTLNENNRLKYNHWEYHNRQYTNLKSDNRVGYIHLKAMGSENISEWVREYFPQFKKDGLVIDVRNNKGGNIDSWILEKLLRRAWFFWQPRVGEPYSNMQYAFRGHLVVLCNESTASDGEAFCEGFRRLNLGPVIGTRTWGGEIWLSYNNLLKDRGIASAAQTGVFDEKGDWLIEGHGVDPDIVVDNPPHETFLGKDAQLDSGIEYLIEKIEKEPIYKPKHPEYPDLKKGFN